MVLVWGGGGGQPHGEKWGVGVATGFGGAGSHSIFRVDERTQLPGDLSHTAGVTLLVFFSRGPKEGTWQGGGQQGVETGGVRQVSGAQGLWGQTVWHQEALLLLKGFSGPLCKVPTVLADTIPPQAKLLPPRSSSCVGVSSTKA